MTAARAKGGWSFRRDGRPFREVVRPSFPRSNGMIRREGAGTRPARHGAPCRAHLSRAVSRPVLPRRPVPTPRTYPLRLDARVRPDVRRGAETGYRLPGRGAGSCPGADTVQFFPPVPSCPADAGQRLSRSLARVPVFPELWSASPARLSPAFPAMRDAGRPLPPDRRARTPRPGARPRGGKRRGGLSGGFTATASRIPSGRS
jgi:hypothetical protein